MLHTHSLPIPFLLHDSLKGTSSQQYPRAAQTRFRIIVRGGVSCSLLFLLFSGRGERSSLLPSSWFRRHLVKGLISWRKNAVGNFGPQSELCVCPLPSVGDDISFIMRGNHVELQYTGKNLTMICHLEGIHYSKLFFLCCLYLVAVIIIKKNHQTHNNN